MKNYLLIVLFIAMSTCNIYGTPPIFYIEGNTGSGKTTLLYALAEKNSNFVVLEEPVAQVQNVDGINALHMMYTDQSRWSFTVHLFYYIFHIHNLQKAISQFPHNIIITDRSIFSGQAFCYAEKESGHFHHLEEILYKELSKLSSSSIPKPHGFIYLRTSPEISFERISRRRRKEEAHVDIEYWKNLHEGHENMLIKTKTIIGDIPVLVLEGDSNMHQNPSFITDSIRTIELFIQQCIKEHKN
jgi:deoxyadenosine/deoxycytidine kinase